MPLLIFNITNNYNSLSRKNNAVNMLIFFLALASTVYLSGCAVSTGLPTSKELAAIQGGDRAVVILRVDCTIENHKFYEPFSSFGLDDNISFGLGSFETGGKPDRLQQLRFMSPESRRTGWTYFVLPHGTYYLAVYPPRLTGVIDYARSLENVPSWRMDIPANTKFIYAGTLRITADSNWLLFGNRIVSSIRYDEITVADERQTAIKLFTEIFPGLGEMQTILMRRQEGSIILHSPLSIDMK